MIYEDVETCGKYGMVVLIQYAIDDGPIIMFSPWARPVKETLDLIEMFCENEVCGFNLAFDWFHICKLYTTFKLFHEQYGNEFPEDFIDVIGVLEAEARDGPCLKPKASMDLMLHARKGPYQSMMNRDDIRIKRVPTVLAWELADELHKRIPLKDIYFARNKGKVLDRWKVYDVKDEDGADEPEFKDIVCRFCPSTALKALAVDALGYKQEEILKFDEIACTIYPVEVGWAPFALAIGNIDNWKGAWPDVIHYHIRHWGYNELARTYAKNDIVFTRGLYEFFGRPPVNDDDSVLACMVAAVRWRGFKVDLPGIAELREEALSKQKRTPTAPAQVKIYLSLAMTNAVERLVLKDTKKITLEELVKNEHWLNEDGTLSEVQRRAQEVLDARKATKEVELYDKLLQAGRFHASFVVIGTKSSRMSGSDKLNPQGINHSKKVRSKFPLAWEDLVLCGGDFSSFEVSLAAAVYKDPLLDEDLKLGKKMAGLFGEMFFPQLTYDEILETEGDDTADMYDKAKRGMYQFFYGGTPPGMAKKIGIEIQNAESAVAMLIKRYPGIGKAQSRINDMFGSMRQAGGIGSKVVWNEPAEYIESPLGFRRYFTLENRICKALFDLSNKQPKHWKDIKIKVLRREHKGEQYVSGACQSALYAAAFNIQSSMIRAACNHEIQCFGSQITKGVQCEVWKFQPVGIQPWHVMPMNVHDEIDAPCKKELRVPIQEAVLAKIETYRPMVPLIKMKWATDMSTWKGKT